MINFDKLNSIVGNCVIYNIYNYLLDIIMMLMKLQLFQLMVMFTLRLLDKFEVQRNSKYPETGPFPRSHLLSFQFLLNNAILPGAWRETFVCDYPTSRMLQDQSFFSFSSVTLRVPPSIPGTKRGIIDPLVSKRPEKILNNKIPKKNEK